MNITNFEEPQLQFERGSHVDVRAGIAMHGAFDRGASHVPVPIRVGLVGTPKTTDGFRAWLEKCRNGLPSAEKRLVELRPDFPGMTESTYGTHFELSEATTRTISTNEIQAAIATKDPMPTIVKAFFEHARDLTQRGVKVVVVAPPLEVFKLCDEPAAAPDAPLDETSDDTGNETADGVVETPPVVRAPSFHDLFKAAALDLAAPSQVVRPDTYGGGSTRRHRRGKPSIQDESTRAWNLHTALYYKAGCVPWRLVRRSTALATCYVGVSFFKTVAGDRMLTSVAQVFNERGEGLVVQGGNAHVDRYDRSSHLAATDASQLLADALASYRREHMTMPARVLVHKTSYFNEAEINGFREAAAEQRISTLDLVGVRRAGIRLLRDGILAVMRGTCLMLDEQTGIVYLRGSVPYFRTYPGMYVPSPLEFVRNDGETPALELAREMLELGKLNFNNTQFDGGEPLTVRAARRVGDILKHVSPNRVVQAGFRHFT
jgi:hypothetical protein